MIDAPPARRALPPRLVLALVATGLVLSFLLGRRASAPEPTGPTPRPTSTLVIAVRDLARLETTQLHVERVIDLTDTQSRFFGMVQATDAILLVAAGDVTIGVDLSKLKEGDVSLDPTTKRASFVVPEPEVFSSRLDEERTYVYTRSTSLIAKRNERLEARARQEAVASFERAARDGDTMDRAKRQAERELRSIALGLGATDASFVWR
jgi:hypothetical protein